MPTKTAPKPQRPPREIRQAHRLPMIRVAAANRRAEVTIRLYEANREAVSVETREQLDAYYAGLEAKLANADPTPRDAA